MRKIEEKQGPSRKTLRREFALLSIGRWIEGKGFELTTHYTSIEQCCTSIRMVLVLHHAQDLLFDFVL